MAKKGRVARILTTLHRVAGTPMSEALKRRQRSAVQRGDAGTHSGTVSQWRKRKDRQRRREQFEGAAKETGLPHGYHSGMRILLVGEGNLSFALALTTLFDGDGSNLLVTSFDRQRIARAAYPYCEDVEESLTAAGAAVVFDVDVEEPDALRGVAKRWWAAGDDDGGDNPTGRGVGPGGHFKGFDRVVFNFPDAGVGVTPPPVRQGQPGHARRLLRLGEGFVKTKRRGARGHPRGLGLDARPRVGVERDGRGGAARTGVQGVARLRARGVPRVRALQDAAARVALGRRRRARGGWGPFENGENEGRVEANDDDVAEGAKTLVFQVDDAPKGGKDGSELIRKGKTWSLK